MSVERATRTNGAWLRYTWLAGIVYVVALLAESAVGTGGVSLTTNDSPAKIATRLHEHRVSALVIAYLSVVYAVAFAIYIWRLYDFLREHTPRPLTSPALVLIGGVPFITLHAVSDIGITGLLGAKLASYGAQHDAGLSYTLYLLTYALDSVGDVFGSLALLATGLLAIRSGLLPRWLGWFAIVAGCLFVLQGFGLGGVIATFGLVLDLIGFLLFLIFVVASSVILLRRGGAVPSRHVAVPA